MTGYAGDQRGSLGVGVGSVINKTVHAILSTSDPCYDGM